MCLYRAQGATEYLVLLAVVLIVALVSVALLGFFPGMASDAQMTQSKTYWQAASPIAITEMGAVYAPDCSSNPYTHLYLRVRNNGAYPITITKVLAGSQAINRVCTGYWGPEADMGTRYTISPGAENYFGFYAYFPGLPDPGSGNRQFIYLYPSGASGGGCMFGSAVVQSFCSLNAPYGTMSISGFGFEYTETIDGQVITKRQVGAKPLMIKCSQGLASC